MNWLKKLKQGLSKTSSKISTGVTDIFTKRKLDKNMLEELEELLITTDMGATTASKITAEFAKKNKFDKEVDISQVKEELANSIEKILLSAKKKEIDLRGTRVILVCGVNGNGKTTTVGKLASFYQSIGKKVMIAACDTFRAAAVEQLKIWAERVNCPIIIGPENADPASVAYKAVEEAKKNNIDILLIDTAGRLQNKNNLMQELAKICRVIKKIDETAPHDTYLVLDATTGQNAYNQYEKFNEIVKITDIIVTKLDGTAKAGVVISLVEKYQLSIAAIGVGEGIDDLKPFDSREFARNLVGIE